MIAKADPLPETVPVFPLGGALVLPRATLPLNIFEPRYLAMVRDAMAGERLIGMVQPRGAGARPPLYEVGGLGRITAFAETGDGRIIITLTGVGRFRIAEELKADTPYRQVRIDRDAFVDDRLEPGPLSATARAALEEGLRDYLDGQGLSADWDAVASADDESLVHTLAAVCPFDAAEKQALLEAADLKARAATLAALMAFASPAGSDATLQ